MAVEEAMDGDAHMVTLESGVYDSVAMAMKLWLELVITAYTSMIWSHGGAYCESLGIPMMSMLSALETKCRHISFTLDRMTPL